jgi:LysR family transcriptional regulator, hydrogen peroxide-inducible genes activator
MNIRDLEYLVALAEHKHFGKAAQACFVSQPTLSMQVKKLEDELGVSIFERRNKNILLTEDGMQIVNKARQILSYASELTQYAKVSQDPYAGTFKLGAFPTLAPYMFPLVVPKLSANYPKIKLFLFEEKTDALVKSLQEGSLDAILLASEPNDPSLKGELIFEEAFYLAVPAEHPLTKRRCVKQKDLANYELLLLDEGHCFREQALEVCSWSGASEQSNFRGTSLETIRQMVAAKAGITLIPRLAVNQKDEYIKYIPFQNPMPVRQVKLYWRKSSTRTKLLNSLVADFKVALKEAELL